MNAAQFARMRAVGARLTLEAAQVLAIGGPVWQITRSIPGTPSADETVTLPGSVTAYVNRYDKRTFERAAAKTALWDADWLVYAVVGTDIQNGDVLSDGARAFVITGTPDTDLGTLLAPAEMTALPD